ncbi:MAG: TonB-dependent receptor [Myxococcota bacterium]
MTELVATGGRVLAVLAEPFTEVTSRTWWPFLLVAGVTAVGVHVWRALPTERRGLLSHIRGGLGVQSWRSRSAVLDVQLLVVRQLLALLGVLPRLGTAWAVATFLVRGLDRGFGRPDLVAPPGPLLAVAYTLVLFVVWDLSRYVLHRALHASPLLWQFHQVHHSAEVLTPLTFHRVHPVEALLYEARGVLVTGLLAGSAYWLWRGDAVALTVLGVDAVGFVLSGLTGNLRHSHVWIGFGPRVERWLLSPAQHQLHHGADRRENGSNFGVWLACWDRLAGSLRLAGPVPPVAFGLAPGVANHGQDLGSALLGPLRGAAARFGWARRSLVQVALLGALVVAPREASARDTPEDEPPPPAPGEGEEIVVSGSRRAPAVGGAAHEVDQETLERYEHDDIQRVLARVPGVYVRGEDGFGLRPNIGMRGANSDRSAKITLLEDGVPLSPAPYAAPAAYYFPLTTRLVGVEVFKGPSAIAYGPQTIGGAVNLLTRRVPTELDGELDVAAGAWSTLKAHGWGGVGGPRAGVLIEGSHLSSGGFKELDNGGPTGFERQDLMAKGRLTFDGAVRHDLELKLGYGRERSDETYLGLSLEDFEATPYRRYAASQQDEMSWQHTQESVSWSVAAADRLTVRTVAYHSWFDRTWTKLNRFAGGPSIHDLLLNADAGQAATYAAILRGDEDSVTADQGLLLGTNARTFHNYGVQSVARLWAGGGKVSNLAELGIRFHGDQVSRLHTEDPRLMFSGTLVPSGGDTAVTLDTDTTAHALSGWLRDDLEVGPVHVVPGVRIEHIRTTSFDIGRVEVSVATEPVTRTHVLPGLAVSVEPSHWLMAFAGVHRGFSPVPPGEAADVPPETAWNAELGARIFPGQTYVEVVGFGSAYQNLYGQCTLSSGCADDQVDSQFAGGEALVGGVESILSHELLLPRDMSLRGNATYTYTWSAFQSGFVSEFPQWGTVQEGDRLPYVPEHQGAVEVLFTMPRASLGVTSTLRGAMRDVAGQGDIPREELLPTAVVFDIAADVRVTDQVTAYLVARNVTDAVTLESLRPFGARPGAPRTILVGVKVAPRRK